MRSMRLVITAAITSFFLATVSTASARPPIDLVLLADSSPAVARSAQHWAATFSTLGIDGVQIRSARPGETVGIEMRGTPDAPSYHVVGELAGGEIVLPGGRFGPHDTQQLSKWLDELGKHGSAGVTEKKGAFGLLPKQTEQARDGLSAAVDFATKGLPAAAAVAKIGQKLKYSLAIDPDIQQAIAADDPVRDDLQGLTLERRLPRWPGRSAPFCGRAKPPAADWNTRSPKPRLAKRLGRSAGRPIKPREKSSRH